MWAVGLRSGGRGGPLVIEAADVRHVLLAPLDRALVLRPLAWRQLRFGAFAGGALGAVAGLLAFRRLPGPAAGWIGYGALTGMLAVIGALGLALAVSGPGLGRLGGGVLGLAVAGWSAADAATGSNTSPATWLGRLALSPLGWDTGALVGAVTAVAAVGAGLVWIGGCSIEAAERRATLVGQIRFAATLRDIRTVVVLRRQLSQELPRQRRSRPGEPCPARAWVRWPVWRRGWRGIVRFPPLRVVRLAVLGAAAGAAAVGAWRGTTPLIAAAGLALYVAALDAVEPLAQELDHPDRRDGYPLAAGALYTRLMGPSLVVMVGVAAVGAGVAVGLSGLRAAWPVAPILVLPAAGCALAGAVTSVVQGPPPLASATDTLLPPEAAGARAMVRTLWPPALSTLGVAPLLAGRRVTGSGSRVAVVGATTCRCSCWWSWSPPGCDGGNRSTPVSVR